MSVLICFIVEMRFELNATKKKMSNILFNKINLLILSLLQIKMAVNC